MIQNGVSYISSIASVSRMGYHEIMKSLTNFETCPLSKSDRKLARDSAELIEQSESSGMTVLIDGKQVELSGSLASVISASLKMAAEGNRIAWVAGDAEMGTQEAAEYLGVSRPFLVKLLDSGMIPFRKVGVQRRVLASDVIAHKEAERKARRRVLAELSSLDRELGLEE